MEGTGPDPVEGSDLALTMLVTAGPAAGAEIRVETELELGRSGSFAVDAEISLHHARIAADGRGSFIVEDLGSRNGTAVNGRPIDRATRLGAGDTIELGGTVLLVQSSPSAEEVPTRVNISLDIDFDAREATVAVDQSPSIRLVLKDGRWTVAPD